jgi:predicted lipoprotein with Yx(FWY)xxD motif
MPVQSHARLVALRNAPALCADWTGMRALLVVAFALLFAVPAGAGSGAMDSAAVTLTVRDTRYGRILFDGAGRSLYAFTRDAQHGPSRCYGACAAAWPVYYAGGRTLRAGAGVAQSLIGTVKRADGRRQITYNGRPLYYYVGDTRTGQVTCQNVREYGGLWLVVRPSGKLVR